MGEEGEKGCGFSFFLSFSFLPFAMSASGDEWSALLAKANPIIQAWFRQTGAECCSDVRGMWPDPPTCSVEFKRKRTPTLTLQLKWRLCIPKRRNAYLSTSLTQRRRSLLMETVPAVRPSTQPELFHEQRHRVRSLLSQSPGPVAAPVRAEQRGPGTDAVAFNFQARRTFCLCL